MIELIDTLGENFEVFLASVIASGIVLVTIFKTAASVIETNTRERSRREIAAYIAEGSISAEQGERLMKADVETKGPPRC